MTAASGDTGETAHNQGQPEPQGGYEAPPIEAASGPGGPGETPAYGGYEPPPAYPAYQVPDGSAFPPPAFLPPAFPPPAFPPAAGPYGGPYPPPPPGYAPPIEYGTPYPGDYGFPGPQQRRTNTLAIVSLVSSLVGVLCFLGGIVGIVTGAVALNQIKRTHEDGHNLAVAGVAIGVASLVITTVWMIYASS